MHNAHFGDVTTRALLLSRNPANIDRTRSTSNFAFSEALSGTRIEAGADFRSPMYDAPSNAPPVTDIVTNMAATVYPFGANHHTPDSRPIPGLCMGYP